MKESRNGTAKSENNSNEERLRALELAIGQIEKQFGRGSIMRLGEASARMAVETIPTGSLALDIALGAGGIPRGEIEGDMGDSLPGLQARLMSQALRKLTACISRSRTAVIFINQLREKIGVIFGNPETTPGGRALKFYSSVRIDLRRAESLKQNGTVIGSRVRAKVVKNKIAPPFRVAEFDIIFSGPHIGISREGDIIDLATEYGILKKQGAFYSYGEQKLGQGREQAKDYLRENPELAQQLETQIRAKSANTPQPVSVSSALEEGDAELS